MYHTISIVADIAEVRTSFGLIAALEELCPSSRTTSPVNRPKAEAAVLEQLPIVCGVRGAGCGFSRAIAKVFIEV